MAEDFIPTVSGKKLNFTDPRPENVEIRDIAHGLSMQPRFGGQTSDFYSVAKHSVLVSRELEKQGFMEKIQVYGLLHDAAEAYTGDVPAPLKKELENLKEIEEKIMKAIWEALGVGKPSKEDWKKVKEADRILLGYEASRLVSQDEWVDEVDRSYSLESESMKADKEKFLDRFRALRGENGS